jgi:hypothetical protein
LTERKERLRREELGEGKATVSEGKMNRDSVVEVGVNGGALNGAHLNEALQLDFAKLNVV